MKVMKSSFFTIIITLSFSVSIIFSESQIVSGQVSDDQVLMTIGDRKISTEEFKRIYLKNSQTGESSSEHVTVDDYLDLFVKFKLKVIEAEKLGYDTLPKFVVEFNGYKDQLAKPYLTDEKTIDRLVKEAYERMKYDVNASHILIKVNPDASPEDTLKAWDKVQKIAERLSTGEAFEKVARGTSDDPSAKTNGGNIGYFTVFQTVYPFETAAYNTKPGNITYPVRTRFGYHIIKINNKRKNKGEIKVAHIMIAVPRGSSQETKDKAEKEIRTIYDKLKNGENFEDLARKYSDDYNSAKNGGELPWFGTGRMVKEFENAAFSLQKNGDISKPVQTSFGWHIIKRLDRKEIGTFDEMETEIRKKIISGNRSQIAMGAFVKNLKNKYNFRLDSSNIKLLYNTIDYHSFQNKTWDRKMAVYSDRTLFEFAGRKFTTKDFISFLKSQNGMSKKDTPQWYINNKLNTFMVRNLVNYENDNLANEYPEYRYLVKEYHDGMLLFDISDKNVWSKAIKDTIGLKNFYEQNKNNYLGRDSIEIAIFSLKDASQEKSVNKALKKCKKKKDHFTCLRSYFPPDSVDAPVTLSVHKYEKGEDHFIDEINWKKGYKRSIIESGRNKVILVLDVPGPKPVPLDKIKGQVTSDYQNYLEEEWLKELRKKYPVKINQKALANLKSTIDTQSK